MLILLNFCVHFVNLDIKFVKIIIDWAKQESIEVGIPSDIALHFASNIDYLLLNHFTLLIDFILELADSIDILFRSISQIWLILFAHSIQVGLRNLYMIDHLQDEIFLRFYHLYISLYTNFNSIDYANKDQILFS